MQIKLKNGRVQRYPDAVGRVLIARGIGVEVDAAPRAEVATQAYQTRMLTAAPAQAADPAPYGYKADGTPRKRPAPPARTKAQD